MTYATKYDLRAFTGAILDQGSLGTCSENTLSAAISIISRQISSDYGAISRLQSYYDYREDAGSIGRDSGTSNEHMLKNAVEVGLAQEIHWGYDVSKFKDKPTPDVYAEAAQHKITGYTEMKDVAYMRQNEIVNAVKEKLSEGKTILLGFTVKAWFDSETSQHDITKMNPANYIEDEGRGGHSVLIVGADDSLCKGNGGYIIQNSWGSDVGDNGFFVVPYSEFPFTATTNRWNDSTNSFNLIGMHVINGFEGHDQTWSKERIDIEQMYVSNLDRPADIVGLDWWVSQLKSGQVTRAQISNFIVGSAEYQAEHAGFTTAQIIDEYYVDTLGRHADASGLAFWLSSVNDHGQTLGDIFTNISSEVYYRQTGVDHDYYTNLVNVAATFSITFQQNTNTDIGEAYLNMVTADYNHTETLKIGMAQDLGIL